MTELEEVRETIKHADRILWDEYVNLEFDRVRSAAMQALNLLVDRISKYSLSERTSFVLALTKHVVVHSTELLPVRHPLFAEIVLPILLNNYDRKEPGSAQGLLAFYSVLHGGRLCETMIGARNLSELALLDRAIQEEPNNDKLKVMWLTAQEYWLSFATHEVPSGVLYENETATVAQCLELMRDVDQYEAYAKQIGAFETQHHKIEEWKYYISKYRDFLECSNRSINFKDYLSIIEQRAGL